MNVLPFGLACLGRHLPFLSSPSLWGPHCNLHISFTALSTAYSVVTCRKYNLVIYCLTTAAFWKFSVRPPVSEALVFCLPDCQSYNAAAARLCNRLRMWPCLFFPQLPQSLRVLAVSRKYFFFGKALWVFYICRYSYFFSDVFKKILHLLGKILLSYHLPYYHTRGCKVSLQFKSLY